MKDWVMMYKIVAAEDNIFTAILLTIGKNMIKGVTTGCFFPGVHSVLFPFCSVTLNSNSTILKPKIVFN